MAIASKVGLWRCKKCKTLNSESNLEEACLWCSKIEKNPKIVEYLAVDKNFKV